MYKDVIIIAMFSSHKAKSEIDLILDVESCIVRGSLVIFDKVDIPKIIFSFTSDVICTSGASDSVLIKATLQSIREVLKATIHFLRTKDNFRQYPDIKRKIRIVHYVLSSPWIVSEAKVLSKTFDRPTEISSKYIADLIYSEQKKLSANSTAPLKVIEQKIFEVKLNGYPVTDWEKRKAENIEVSFNVSMAGSAMIDYFVDSCKHFLRGHKVAFHSSLLLQYIGIENVLDPGQNYCLIHVHGDETDISIIKQKSCIFFGSNSFGVRSLIDSISKKIGSGKQTADSMIILYTGNKLDNIHSKSSIEIIEKSAKEWFDNVNLLVEKQGLTLKYPISIIVTAWAHDDFFCKIIKKFDPDLSVYALSIEDLTDKVYFSNSVERRRLVALHSIAIHSLGVQNM